MDVQAKGKLVYIEPNNIRKELGMKFGNGDNISWRPEDLNISVDLQVIIPDRDSCGQTDIGDNFVVNISSIEKAFKGNEWQSFMGGNTLAKDQNYLTTEYTNISFQEIRNNKAGGKENLGIQSIDIQFDSHFFPIVKMKMIDVHGYSLMMPAEEQYRSDLENKVNKLPQGKVCEQFFNALFHFPYPRFALSIKGFYGNRVTFMLAVNDFQSNFNSQTGNFEVEISFIGHMYGVYADIPLSMLLIAPYIDASEGQFNDYWQQQISNGTFFFSDGITQIPTLKDFVVKYEEMDENFKDIYTADGEEFEKIAQVDALRGEIRSLNRISKKYDELFEGIGASEKCTKRTTNSGYLYFTSANSLTCPTNEEFRRVYYDYADPIGLENALKGPNDNSLEDSNSEKAWPTSRETEAPLYTAKETTEGTVYSDTIVEGHPYREKISGQAIIPTEAEKGQRTLLVEKDKEFLKRIDARIDEINKEIPVLLSESTEELNEICRRLLGFVPTVENIMRMIFAHIDAFMTKFYDVLGNIKSKMNNERLLKNIKDLSLDNTDIESKDANKCFIPPFAAYFENDPATNKRVRTYPGDNPALRDFDEIKFVESIYNSILNVRGKMLEAKSKTGREIDGVNVEDEWTPLSFLDLLETKNPYRGVKDKSNVSEYVADIIKFADERFYNATVITGTLNIDTDAEVENFWRIHKNELSNDNEHTRKIIQTLKVSAATESVKDKVDRTKYEAVNSGFYYLEEDSTETYSYKSGFSNVFLNWDYSKNKSDDFAGNIYPLPSGETESLNVTNEFRTHYIQQSQGQENRYHLPVLPYYTKYTGTQNRKYKLERLSDVSPSAIVSSLVGTGSVYRFNKKSSLLRMPKVVALFLGSTINGTATNFDIDANGLYGYGHATELDKMTPTALRELDSTIHGLKDYFNEWAAAEGMKITEDYKEWLASEKNSIKCTKSIKKEKYVDEVNGMLNVEETKSLQLKLMNLVNSTVDFVYINPESSTNAKNISYAPTVAFLKGLLKKIEDATQTDSTIKNGDTETKENGSSTSSAVQRAIKNQMYYTLSDLYDKWLAGYSKDRFLLKSPSEDKEITRKKCNGEISCNTPTTEIENFVYIDTFYNDIGDIFLIDPKSVVDVLLEEGTNRSVIQLITDIAQKNKLLFIALPVFTNFYDKDGIASIFTPQGLYGANEFSFNRQNTRGIGNTYVMMYTHEPSRMANITKNSGNSTTFKNDYVDMADTTGNISPVALKELETNMSDSGYTIPAFGVTFAAQNQMYFKNINVSMANPRQTDVSLQNTFILAEMERKGDTRNTTNTVGQDLYSIYSNRAYDCVVDMMGCMDIMPTMYFQLNNIPLFKGAYRIVGVKHHIENGSMSTTFSGTRISKNAIPFNNNVIDIESLINKMRNVENSGEGENDIYGPFEFDEQYPGVGYKPDDIDESLPTFNVATAIAAFKSKEPKMPVGVAYAADSIYDNTKSLARCATAVKLAVNAGMIYDDNSKNATKWIGGYNGWRCEEILTEIGFTEITGGTAAKYQDISTKGLVPGDIATINPHKDQVVKGDPNYGHICFYDGHVWISDFRQDGGANCYKSAYDNVNWKIFRYTGNTVLPKGYQPIVVCGVTGNVKVEIANTEISSADTKDGKVAKTVVVKATENNGSPTLSITINFTNLASKDRVKVRAFSDNNDKKGRKVKNLTWSESGEGIKTLLLNDSSLLSCRIEINVK